MASFCSNAILFLLCGCSGVQGSNMDLASLVQARMEGHAQAPWRAQAQSFLGLLQAMGKQVPEEKKAETQEMVQSIITLLTTAKDTLKTEATKTVATSKKSMEDNTEYVTEYNTIAKTAMSVATSTNTKLTKCYADLRALQATYETQCNPIPSSCTPMCTEKQSKTKHEFVVAKKFEWKCAFNNSETADTCTNNNSELKQDLVAKKNAMLEAYAEWQETKAECEAEEQKCAGDCTKSGAAIEAKKTECATYVTTCTGKLCAFKSAVHTRSEWKVKLETSITDAEVMHGTWSEKTQFIDLSLIICIFKRFKANMNFAQDDYSACQESTANPVFVDPPALPSPRLPAGLISADNIKFGGGLADKYLGEMDAHGTPKLVDEQVDIDFTTRPQCS